MAKTPAKRVQFHKDPRQLELFTPMSTSRAPVERSEKLWENDSDLADWMIGCGNDPS